jgi:integrase
MALVQLFENLFSEKKLAPDKVDINVFDVKNIQEDFVISRSFDGKVLSRYRDNLWDLRSYRSNPSQHGILNFLRINYNCISDAKEIMFLLFLFGSGRKNSLYSTQTLSHYFNYGIVPLSEFAINNNITIKNIFENKNYLIRYISTSCNNKDKIQNISCILIFLDKFSNDTTKINYKKDTEAFILIQEIRNSFQTQNQIEVIPSRILAESIKQRWKHIENIEKDLNNLINFFNKFIKSKRFAASESRIITLHWSCDKTISWNNAVKKFNLNELFNKYKINNRLHFQSFLTKIQGTCKHLIHSYTGMRKGEVLNMKNNCLESISTESGICRIVSTTSKSTGTNKNAKWVTSKEIKRILFILNSINSVVAKNYNLNVDNLPLFIGSEFFIEKIKVDENLNIKTKSKYGPKDELPLDYSLLTLTIEDKKEIEEIDFNKNTRNLKINKLWEFKSHQYRRSLAVYSIQSGIVSLGALQIQLKHLFREMTLYNGNGASYAKKLFDIPLKEHISKDIETLKPELDTLAYIKNVIFSNESSFGIHGSLVEKDKKKIKIDFETYFFENREKTLKQFKNGDMAYKETALGGCISTEACDSRLTRSITSCFDCHGGVLKKSKVDNVIQKQKEFISFLDKNSIEYKTEVDELSKLENLRNKLIKE